MPQREATSLQKAAANTGDLKTMDPRRQSWNELTLNRWVPTLPEWISQVFCEFETRMGQLTPVVSFSSASNRRIK
jgi:hypothetical protein